MMSASYYTAFVKKAASWGYGVVHYDIPLLSLTAPVIYEVEAFQPMRAWLKHLINDDGKSPLYQQLDLSHVVVAGHSRGGKIASLIFSASGNGAVKAGWLIDPIDESAFAPISKENPSGVAALRASGKAIGVEGAGIKSSCNPPAGNYSKFFAAGARGSWQVFLPKASHSSFENGGAGVNFFQDLACGKGKISRPETAELSTTPMLTWFWKQLHKNVDDEKDEESDPVKRFRRWARRQEAVGLMVFTVKREIEKDIQESVLSFAVA